MPRVGTSATALTVPGRQPDSDPWSRYRRTRLVDSTVISPCPAPTHTHATVHRRRPRYLRRIAIGAGVVVVVAVAVGVAVVAHSSDDKVSAAPTTTPAGVPAASTLPLNVVAVTPADGATGVPSDATVTVRFSEPLSAHSPMPTLTPAVAGTWQQADADHLGLRGGSAPLVPSSTETVTVPAGPAGC